MGMNSPYNYDETYHSPGFSFPEILVVIAIIVILAAVIIPCVVPVPVMETATKTITVTKTFEMNRTFFVSTENETFILPGTPTTEAAKLYGMLIPGKSYSVTYTPGNMPRLVSVRTLLTPEAGN